MKKLIIIVAIASIFGSCGKEQIAKLGSTKDSLQQVVAMKDSIINEAFMNIDEIASSLGQISTRENLVTKQTEGDITKTTKQQITDNINAISGLLEQNREALARLDKTTKKLSAANVEIGGLTKLVASLKKQLDEKDANIAELTKEVEKLHGKIAELTTSVTGLSKDKTQLEGTVSEQSDKINTQTEKINTVYYIVGTEKDLMAKKIIAKKGTIGRTIIVGSNQNRDGYTKGDLRNIERIPVGGKKATIVSVHPEGSYMLVESSRNVTDEIVITDKDAFWSSSKILIISYK